MLPLDDPLWQKLDDAHRDRNIPALILDLAESWDDETARSLFWDCLCHQETCYGATYAAIPHLLDIAQPERNWHQRQEVALFLGAVALYAFEARREPVGKLEDEPLQGLPQTLEAWDRKLDCYRDLVSRYENPNRPSSPYEQTELLPRYRSILAISPMNSDDMEKIKSIRAEFFSVLPRIRAMCERAFLESLHDGDVVSYLLSGIAAADGLLDLAYLLSSGSDGMFRCSCCHWTFEFIQFGECVAIYADENPPSTKPRLMRTDRPAQRDFRQRTPSRADGFMLAVQQHEVLEPRARALLALAERVPSSNLALLLQNFLGSFLCTSCGARGPIRAM